MFASAIDSISTSSFLTLVTYLFAITILLPRVSYVTRMDRFILLSTLMVFAGLIHTVANREESGLVEPEVVASPKRRKSKKFLVGCSAVLAGVVAVLLLLVMAGLRIDEQRVAVL